MLLRIIGTCSKCRGRNLVCMKVEQHGSVARRRQRTTAEKKGETKIKRKELEGDASNIAINSFVITGSVKLHGGERLVAKSLNSKRVEKAGL